MFCAITTLMNLKSHYFLKTLLKKEHLILFGNTKIQPDFGVSDVEWVLQLILPGQASAQPLNHAVAKDLQVTPS